MRPRSTALRNRLLGERRRYLAVMLFLLSGASGTVAQQNPSQVAAAAAAPAWRQASPPSARTGIPPDPAQRRVSQEQAVYLVRATLLTLNDANRSGNYTVLRDLAAPDFQAKNTAADLAQSFVDLRRRKFDLFAAALIAPQFSTAPELDSDGRARLTGYFPTQPLQIRFDLTFQSVDGQWRLFAISVATPEAPRSQSQFSYPPQRHSPGMIYDLRLFSGSLGRRW